jgi:hypothetical protein
MTCGAWDGGMLAPTQKIDATILLIESMVNRLPLVDKGIWPSGGPF